MSYWIQKTGNNDNANYKEFRCDKRNDVTTLPTQKKIGTNNETCSIGSECLCLEDSSVWILGTDKWIELGV